MMRPALVRKLVPSPQHPLTRRTLFVLLVLAGLLAAVSVDAPRTLVYFSGRTEIVTLTVVDPLRSLVQLPVAFDLDAGACRKDVAIRPAAGSTLRYERPRGGALLVLVDAAKNTVLVTDGVRSVLDAPTLLRFRASSRQDGCKATSRLRLPANGYLTVGRLYGQQPANDEPVPLVMLGGKLQVYGRAISSLLWVPLSTAPFAPAALYPVEEIQLPGGSELSRALAKELETGPAAERTSWTGYADVNEADDSEALDIEATTNARAVELFLPSPRTLHGVGGAEPDRVSLSLGARVLGDPNLRWLAGIVAVLAALWPTYWSAFNWMRERRRGRVNPSGS